MSVPETMPAVVNMKRLWVHEVLRVFGDRLTDDNDLEWLIKQLRVTLKDRMEVDMDSMFQDLFQVEAVARSEASDFSIPQQRTKPTTTTTRESCNLSICAFCGFLAFLAITYHGVCVPI